jgi:hypothetical protein
MQEEEEEEEEELTNEVFAHGLAVNIDAWVQSRCLREGMFVPLEHQALQISLYSCGLEKALAAAIYT